MQYKKPDIYVYTLQEFMKKGNVFAVAQVAFNDTCGAFDVCKAEDGSVYVGEGGCERELTAEEDQEIRREILVEHLVQENAWKKHKKGFEEINRVLKLAREQGLLPELTPERISEIIKNSRNGKR